MAPVLDVLDSWGAKTPFAQISETAAVGGSVLAVSPFLPILYHVTGHVFFAVCFCSSDGHS